MSESSIPEPMRPENAQTETPFPTSGDNFITVIDFGDSPDHQIASMQAFDFLEDCMIALDHFEPGKHCTGTLKHD